MVRHTGSSSMANQWSGQAMSRKPLSTRIVDLIQAEDESLPLTDRNLLITQKTGAPLPLIERIRRNTTIHKGPDW